MLLFLTGCATSNQTRINEAAKTKVAADLVDQALTAARQKDPLPGDCRVWQRSGVKDGDRLDVALLKTDQALTQANLRVRRCADWYER